MELSHRSDVCQHDTVLEINQQKVLFVENHHFYHVLILFPLSLQISEIQRITKIRLQRELIDEKDIH